MIDHPDVNRLEATKKLIEAAGAKLISMYNMPAEGPVVPGDLLTRRTT